MGYLEDLDGQIIQEYKSGNAEKRVFLQTLKAALAKKKIDLKDSYNEDVAVATLKNELKQLNESLKEQEGAGRNDLAEQSRSRITMLEQILPKQLSDEELEKKVGEILAGLEDKSFGSAMKVCMEKLKTEADGGKIAQIVKKALNQNA